MTKYISNIIILLNYLFICNNVNAQNCNEVIVRTLESDWKQFMQSCDFNNLYKSCFEEFALPYAVISAYSCNDANASRFILDVFNELLGEDAEIHSSELVNLRKICKDGVQNDVHKFPKIRYKKVDRSLANNPVYIMLDNGDSARVEFITPLFGDLQYNVLTRSRYWKSDFNDMIWLSPELAFSTAMFLVGNCNYAPAYEFMKKTMRNILDRVYKECSSKPLSKIAAMNGQIGRHMHR